MFRVLATVLVCSIAMGAHAQDGGKKMTREELLTFLPGAKVKHISQAGSERHWTNELDGTLMANSNNKQYGNLIGTKAATHAGTWAVNDEGKYCIDIDWKRVHEKWCSFIIQTQDGSYYLNSVDEKRKIEFVAR